MPACRSRQALQRTWKQSGITAKAPTSSPRWKQTGHDASFLSSSARICLAKRSARSQRTRSSLRDLRRLCSWSSTTSSAMNRESRPSSISSWASSLASWVMESVAEGPAPAPSDARIRAASVRLIIAASTVGGAWSWLYPNGRGSSRSASKTTALAPAMPAAVAAVAKSPSAGECRRAMRSTRSDAPWSSPPAKSLPLTVVTGTSAFHSAVQASSTTHAPPCRPSTSTRAASRAKNAKSGAAAASPPANW
mmetsp:Transcript_33981/g.95554  ORF Transcript_33981/g.95554 Transcript_33981/m.95554 type:complete len:250 (-) Transcript_33981:853-1602(-)